METQARFPLREGETLEPLSKGISVIVGNGHTFNTDTILLASFSLPKNGEHCADFGTGCGTIPLVWCARSRPASIAAVELQHAACDMARRSFAGNGLENTARVVECDICALREKQALPLDLDLVACNPPYKEAGAGVPNASERERIARHETACSFADIAAAAAAFLRWGGRFCCCMRPERLCGTMLTLHEAGLEPKLLRFVQQRSDSAPFLFLLQARRGGRPGMEVGPAFLVENGDGSLSDEMRCIYGDYKEGRA